MERRKFVIGMGSLAAGGAAATGTGAFTSAEVDRSVGVDVQGDADAYLGLAPADTPNGNAYARVEGSSGDETDQVTVDFNGIDNNNPGSINSNGTGVNVGASYIFEDVVEVTNQGSQEVTLSIDGNGDVINGDASNLSDGNNAVAAYVSSNATIGVGESTKIDFAVEIDDDGPGSQTLSGEVLINANAN